MACSAGAMVHYTVDSSVCLERRKQMMFGEWFVVDLLDSNRDSGHGTGPNNGNEPYTSGMNLP